VLLSTIITITHIEDGGTSFQRNVGVTTQLICDNPVLFYQVTEADIFYILVTVHLGVILVTVHLGVILVTVHLGVILVTVHLGVILINNQLDAQFLIQRVPGGMCQTSGGCSLCYNIPI